MTQHGCHAAIARMAPLASLAPVTRLYFNPMRSDEAPADSSAEMRRHYALVFVCEAVVIASLWILGRMFS
jgi:hypothetical protein